MPLRAGRWARRVLSVLAIAGMMGGGTFRPQVGFASSAQVAHIQVIPVTTHNIGIPALYGNVVAWSDNVIPRPAGLYIADVRHFKPQLVARSLPRFAIIQVRISADWLIWEDQQIGAGGWYIWALNRNSRRPIEVASSATAGSAPDPLDYPALTLSGDVMAWSQTGCGNSNCVQGLNAPTWTSSIVVKRLPGGHAQVVRTTRAPCAQAWPDLSGSTLVWHQEGRCGGQLGTDVFLDDLGLGVPRALTASHRASEAVTNGRYVAWKDAPNRLENGSIVLMDLRTRTETTVSRPAWQQPGCVTPGGGTSPCATQPEITSRVVSWLESNGDVVVARDLQTGHLYVLAVSHGVATSRSGRWITGLNGPSAGHRVVWKGCRCVDQGPTKKHPARVIAHQYIGVATVP